MFNDVLVFLQEHWEVILISCLSILSFVLALIRKKPVLNKLDKYLVQLLEQIPVFIDIVEKKGHGVEKKMMVMELCKDFLADQFGFYDFESVSKFISEYIETVLTTPQKKETKLYNFDDEKED